MRTAERRAAKRARIGTAGWVVDRLLFSAAMALIAGGTAGFVLWLPTLFVGGVG